MPLALETSGIWLAILSRADNRANCLARREVSWRARLKSAPERCAPAQHAWRPSVVRRKIRMAVTAPYKFKRIGGTIPNIFQEKEVSMN
jgi:hypothetical protein